MAQHGTIWDCLTSSYIHVNQLGGTESRSNTGVLKVQHFVSTISHEYGLAGWLAGWDLFPFKTWEVKSRIWVLIYVGHF